MPGVFHGLSLAPTGSPALRLARAACVAGLGLFFLALSIQEIWIADLWWQLRTGQWVAQHHAVPTVDTLSYTAAGHEWIELRWLYCLAAWLLWSAGGPALLIVVEAVLLAAAFGVLVWRQRRTALSLPGLLILTLGIWGASGRFVVRPELVSYLLVPVFLVVLDAMRLGRPKAPAWLLPTLQVLWTNAHTLFIFGPVLAWAFSGGALLDTLLVARRGSGAQGHGWRRPERVWRRLAAVAALTTAACWINPYLHRGANFPFLLFKEIRAGSILSTTVTEFRSPFGIDLWSWDLKAAAALAALSAATFVLCWKRTDPVRLALWAAFLYLAAVAVRNVALFAIAATWISLRNLEDAVGGGRADEAGDLAVAAARVDGKPDQRASQWPRLLASTYSGLALVLAAGAWYVVTGRYDVEYGCDPRFGLGVIECDTPALATSFILSSAASPQLFHAMSDGSYLTWAAQGRFPVFVDGRLEVYGEAFIEEYLNVARRDWDQLAERWKINTVLAHREHLGPLIKKLIASPRWVLVHLDPRDVVFVRDIPEHASLIAKYRIDPKAPWVPRAPEPDERPSGWRRWIGSVPRPWYSFGMAETFLALGGDANAARYLERALPLLAHDPRLRVRLGQLYFEAKDYSRSAAALREALRELPENPALRCELAQALYLAGDQAGALEAYSQALRDDPRMYEAHFNIGVILARRGETREAIGHFREALRARPGDPASSRILSGLEAGR